MKSTPIPTGMKAIVLKDYNATPESLALLELPVPRLKSGQVLVKMAASPINPSDLTFMKGEYGITKPVPVVPGFEGSGTVVASGGGWRARWLVGKRVACRAPEDGDGTWAEYMAADAGCCIPLFENIPFEQGACLIVNPMTACALIEMARDGGHTTFIQTAAASALGLMIARLGMRFKMTGIHVVRRPEQVKALKEIGCYYVYDLNDPLFNERLGEACYKFKARIAFDAVGGELTQRLALAMPPGSRVVVYGSLSGDSCQISPRDLIFQQEKVEGFWLSEWIKSKTLLQKWNFARMIQKRLPTELFSKIQAQYPLAKFTEAIELYKKQRSSGKVLLTPSGGN